MLHNAAIRTYWWWRQLGLSFANSPWPSTATRWPRTPKTSTPERHDQALWAALDELTVPYGNLTVTLWSLIDSWAWK
jgi:hypothetical protein